MRLYNRKKEKRGAIGTVKIKNVHLWIDFYTLVQFATTMNLVIVELYMQDHWDKILHPLDLMMQKANFFVDV